MEDGDGRGWELTKGGSRRLHFHRCRCASGGWPWIGGKGVGGGLVSLEEGRRWGRE
jgi:hypothetical protein